jgi:hypothetical protein
VLVEPLFAEAKDRHGVRRFRLRTLEKVNVEALLIGAGQNVKRLLTCGRRGPRREAQVAALRQPAPNPYEPFAVRRHCNRRSRCPAQGFSTPGLFSEISAQPPPSLRIKRWTVMSLRQTRLTGLRLRVGERRARHDSIIAAVRPCTLRLPGGIRRANLPS